MSRIYGHPSQEYRWHFLGLIAAHLSRRRRPKNRRRRGSVEGDDLTCANLDDDPCAARTGRLIFQRPPDEPVVESARSAVESLETMFAGEKFRAGVGHYEGCSSTDRLVSSLIIAGGTAGGSERSSCNSVQASSSTTNTRRSANSISAASTACRRTYSFADSPRASAALRRTASCSGVRRKLSRAVLEAMQILYTQ